MLIKKLDTLNLAYLPVFSCGSLKNKSWLILLKVVINKITYGEIIIYIQDNKYGMLCLKYFNYSYNYINI